MLLLFLFVCHISVTFANIEVPTHRVIIYTIPTITLNDGNKMPMIALGTGISNEDVIKRMDKIIVEAIEAGYRHIDTAALYKDEAEIGAGIKDAIAKGLVKREDLFITTKLPWIGHHGYDQVVPALKESLSRLDLDFVDMYLIHQPYAKPEVDILDTWRGMEEAKRLNLTKSIGVSNFNAEQINRILANCEIRPANNQIEVNPSETREAMVAYCQKQGIVVSAYCPFGYMVPRSRGGSDPPLPRIDDPMLTAIGKKYNKTTMQVVLRYLIDRDLVPLPLTTNKRHMQQNIEVFDFKLTPEEIAIINGFNTNNGVLGYELDATIKSNDELYSHLLIQICLICLCLHLRRIKAQKQKHYISKYMCTRDVLNFSP